MTTTIPAGWKLLAKKTCYVLMHDGAVIATLAGPESKENAAIIARMLAAPGASTAGNPQPARDWELTCHECDGYGHVYVKHQVAERQSDVQEFKEECECCEGRGFVFAFQDIPGIEEYVKACRTAPAAPGVSTVEAQPVAWMDPDTQDVISAERKASWLNEYGAGGAAKAAMYTRALGDLRPAPAAGDALDAKRYRAIRNPPYSDRYGDLYAMTFQGDGDIPLKGDELDAAADAAIAAQRKGDA